VGLDNAPFDARPGRAKQCADAGPEAMSNACLADALVPNRCPLADCLVCIWCCINNAAPAEALKTLHQPANARGSPESSTGNCGSHDHEAGCANTCGESLLGSIS